jgi:hypothetical protein
LAAVAYVVFNAAVFGNDPEKVIISVDGSEYASYRLSEILKPEIVRVETEFGVNVIEITNHGARVIEATCPDKLDVHSGEISKSGQMIVCLPNRLTVRLQGKKCEVDRVAY